MGVCCANMLQTGVSAAGSSPLSGQQEEGCLRSVRHGLFAALVSGAPSLTLGAFLAQETTVDFNALPLSVRERFIGCLGKQRLLAPILANPVHMWKPFLVWGVCGWCCLSFAGMFLTNLSEQDLGDDVFFIAFFFFACVFLTLACRPILQRVRMPFRAGLYIFPTDLVDARSLKLRRGRGAGLPEQLQGVRERGYRDLLAAIHVPLEQGSPTPGSPE
jgi:hypothetical protein